MSPMPVIVDIRAKVARQPDAHFGTRKLSDIRGVVFHQVLGSSDVYQVARYHVSKVCHIAPGKGCPSICYVYFVDYDGTIYQCNDREDVTWSQGGAAIGPNGGQPNTNYLAVVFRGDFTGTGHVGPQAPTDAQLASAGALWNWLRDDLGLYTGDLYGHEDFGKPACPGAVLHDMIIKLRAEPSELAGRTPTTDAEWQRALVLLGFDLGKFGPAGDGVDGDWGPKSDAALLAFQVAQGIPRKGRDVWTATKIAVALREAGKPVGCLKAMTTLEPVPTIPDTEPPVFRPKLRRS